MKETRKQFIKEAHSAACSDWQRKIEKEFPKLFEKEEFEEGDWLIYSNSEDFILKFKKFSNKSKTYFESSENIGDDRGDKGWVARFFRKAKPEEIKSHLISEAKKRGFKKGIHHATTNGVSIIEANSDTFGYNEFEDKLVFNNWSIYQEGKWAEIIQETITKKEAEKQLGKTII